MTSNTRAGASRGRFHAASAAAADDDEDDDEETDDVNRGRNNVVVLSSLPGSAAQRQPQASPRLNYADISIDVKNVPEKNVKRGKNKEQRL